MRIFYDCEFVERGRDLPIQLVSIGLIREDNQRLYLINEECLSNVMKHPWLSVNVVPYLPIHMDSSIIFEWSREHWEYDNVVALDKLVMQVREFVQATPNAELWAYYGAYDHVVFCQLFGSMAELPAGIPMFTHELQQLAEENPHIKLPPDPQAMHHALHDAQWVMDAYNRLRPGELLALEAEVLSESVEPLDTTYSDRTHILDDYAPVFDDSEGRAG